MSATGAHPSKDRREREGLAQYRARQRDAFGVDAPPERSPQRAGFTPTPVHPGSAHRLRARLNHKADCRGDRVDDVAWSDGTRSTRCVDCGAQALTGP